VKLASHALGCVAVLSVLGLGCAPPPKPPAAAPPGQSFAEAVRLICDVDRVAGLAPGDDPIAIGRSRSEWLAEHVDNPDGIELKTLLSVKTAQEQAVAIRQQAKELGMGSCAVADSMEQTAMGGLSP
jgi:hypothetical protein